MSDHGEEADGHDAMVIDSEPEDGTSIVTITEISGFRTPGATLEPAVHAKT